MSVVLAVAAAAVASFVISGAWYGAFGDRLLRSSAAYAGPRRPVAVTAVVELVRSAVLATVLAGLVGVLQVGVGGALLLALVLWVGFPVVLLSGSVFHERVPAPLAAIHAGDWLLKLLAVALIVALVE